MKADNKYTVTGGEQVIITGKKCGRLIVEGKKLFLFTDDGIKQTIAPSDILCIFVTNNWFGILHSRGLKFLLDARIYLPKKMEIAA